MKLIENIIFECKLEMLKEIITIASGDKEHILKTFFQN